jgi:hypothetical protein
MSLLRKVLFAFLIISLLGSILSTLVSFAAIFWPKLRLLVYLALIFSSFEAMTSLLVAVILTVLVGGVVTAVNGFGNAVSLYIEQGHTALVFIWLRCLFINLAALYWFAIWFVDVRTISFVRRVRTEEEVGNWRGFVKEAKRDLKGEPHQIRENSRKDVEWQMKRSLNGDRKYFLK